LSEAAAPRDAAPPRERSEFGASVWYQLSVGRAGRAEARWLLPKICDAGGITKDGIGAIRVQEDITYVQIAENLAGKFGAQLELENGVVMERMAGEPSMDRPERAPRKAPAARAPRAEKPTYERAEKPAYVPKPSRLVEEAISEGYDPIKGSEAAPVEAPKPRAPKPYVKREDGEKKPYTPRAEGAKPYAKRDDGDRKPYTPRSPMPAGAKPYAKREDGDRKPYAPRGEAKPYAKREDGDRKPYAPRAEGAKPYAKREDGERKPYAPRGADAKPYAKREDGDKKPYAPRSAGFKSHGGEGKPARATASKSHGGEAKSFAKPARPAAPRADAKDTSKRFVPPSKPKR
jgi:ATP-dependent RNA helicase DeaD